MLDLELRSDPGEMSRIVLHELFHFVWLRLGNPARRSWENLVRSQIRRGAGGELGWSAEHRLLALRGRDLARRTRRWRDYLCESFCDSAAWMYGTLRSHAEFTLKPAFRGERRRWFAALQRHHNGVFSI